MVSSRSWWLGEYGSGKTCLLQWIQRRVFPARGVQSFYFGEPGVHFYRIADALLRGIGRKNVAKMIWEIAQPHLTLAQGSHQTDLFSEFSDYVARSSRPQHQASMTSALQDAIRKAEITVDEEIAHRLARVVTETVRKPYFEYRDFVPRLKAALVPESEEALFFRAILNTIGRATGADGVAFLIDEFEEIGLQVRLTRRAAHEYLATVKRLLNLVQQESGEFWLVLSMTPEAYKITSELEARPDGSVPRGGFDRNRAAQRGGCENPNGDAPSGRPHRRC